jgi:hypothetical protein
MNEAVHASRAFPELGGHDDGGGEQGGIALHAPPGQDEQQHGRAGPHAAAAAAGDAEGPVGVTCPWQVF